MSAVTDLHDYVTGLICNVSRGERLPAGATRRQLAELLTAAYREIGPAALKAWKPDLDAVQLAVEGLLPTLDGPRAEDAMRRAEDAVAALLPLQAAIGQTGATTAGADLTEGETAILEALREAGEPLIGKEVARRAGLDVETVKQYLRPRNTLCKSGLIIKARRGYVAGKV